MPWIGADSVLSFAKETSPGTSIARTGTNYQHVFGITNRDVQLPDRQIQANPLPSFGVGRRYAQVVKGPFSYTGTIPFTILNGTPIYWAMGEDTYSTGVHTVTTRNTFGLPTISLLALLKNNGTDVPFQRIFPGTVCSSMQLSAQVGGALNAEAGVMAFKPVTGGTDGWDVVDTTAETHVPSSFAPSVTAVRPYQWFDVASASDVTVGAVSIGRLEEFTVRIDNRLQVKHYFGSSQEPTEYIHRIPQFSLSGRMVPNSITGSTDQLYSVLMDAATVDVSIKLTRGANDYIKVIAKDCLLTSAPHTMPGEGGEMSVSFQVQPRDLQFEINDDTDADYGTGWYG